MDSMPSACFHQQYDPTVLSPDPYQGNSRTPPAKDYADRHNPFIYYPNIVGNNARCQAHDVVYPQLATDVNGDAVPPFAFITPDTCHDGHDATCSDPMAPGGGGLGAADAWLKNNVPALLTYLGAHNGLLLLTFDEASPQDTSGCCHGGVGGSAGTGGRVGLLAIGNGVTPGTLIHTAYDHASLLRTLEDLFGISEHLNNAAASVAMNDLFAPAVTTPEVPLAVLLPLIGVAALTVRHRPRSTSTVRGPG